MTLFELLAYKLDKNWNRRDYKHRPSQGNNWPDGVRD